MTGMENCSFRMTNTSGAMVVAQMEILKERIAHWSARSCI